MTLLQNQHDLNLTILKKQSKLTKLSITVGFIGIILWAILGAYMQFTLTSNNFKYSGSTVSTKEKATVISEKNEKSHNKASNPALNQ